MSHIQEMYKTLLFKQYSNKGITWTQSSKSKKYSQNFTECAWTLDIVFCPIKNIKRKDQTWFLWVCGTQCSEVIRCQWSHSMSMRCGAYSRAALIKLVGLGAAFMRGAAFIWSAALIRGFTVIQNVFYPLYRILARILCVCVCVCVCVRACVRACVYGRGGGMRTSRTRTK